VLDEIVKPAPQVGEHHGEAVGAFGEQPFLHLVLDRFRRAHHGGNEGGEFREQHHNIRPNQHSGGHPAVTNLAVSMAMSGYPPELTVKASRQALSPSAPQPRPRTTGFQIREGRLSEAIQRIASV
jgi:hypothetical protein